MADPQLMDRMFQLVMRSLIESGRARHYAELANAMGSSVEEGRQRHGRRDCLRRSPSVSPKPPPFFAAAPR